MLMFLSILKTEEEREFVSDLYEKNKQMMYRCAYQILKNREDAEDVVQDIFCLIANKHVNQLMDKPEATNVRFLFVCSRNRAINIAKSKSKLVSLDALQEAGLDIPSGRELTEAIEKTADRETIIKAMAAIEKLDRIYADAIWLQLRGYSIRVIADICGEKEETVKKRLFRGKKLLRDAIGAEGGAA